MRSEKIKALTVWQPWASLIVEGVMAFEFRPWDVPTYMVGQRIVIHAGKREMQWDDIAALRTACQMQDRSCGISPALFARALEILARPSAQFPLMAAIGDVRLGSGQLINVRVAQPSAESSGASASCEAKPKYAWSLIEPRLWATPIPIKGAQGFWDYPLPLPRCMSPATHTNF